MVCGTRAETCLEAAGRGWMGPAGIALLVSTRSRLALWVGRSARGGGTAAGAPSLGRLWLTGSGGVAAICGGQALIAGAIGGPGSLGGGWIGLLALCIVAGGLIAFALRAAPAAAAFVRELRPRHRALRLSLALAPTFPALPVLAIGAPRTPATAGRAPPSA